MALVEALLAASVLGLGLMAASRLVVHALEAALHTRQHSQAQALVQEAIECTLAGSSPCPPRSALQWQGVTYSVQVHVSPQGPLINEITATADWRDGRGAQKIEWRTRASTMPGWVGVSSP